MKNGMTVLAVLAAFAVLAGIPLPEHPRPDWERAGWRNLNGDWKFAFDKKDAGLQEKWFAADDARFDKRIVVPFPWGSALSGVKDEADVGWYRRDVVVPETWKGRRVFLVVGASDHDTKGWIDGHPVGEHSGGYTPFEFELTDFVKWGQPQKLTLRAWDAPAAISQHDWRLYGKQGYGNARGLWQTVYLEARGMEYIEKVHFTPDIENGSVTADVTLGAPAKKPLAFEVRFKESDRAKAATAAFAPGQMSAKLKISLRDVKLWDLDNPYLYEVVCALRDGDREYFYARLDQHFPGLKERYIHAYGNAYEVPSPRQPELLRLFHEECEKYGIWHDNDRIFRYLNTLDEKTDQMRFF